MEPQLTTLEKSPYSGQSNLIRVFGKPTLAMQLETNRLEIMSLQETMYRDGLIAEINYKEGLQSGKAVESEQLIKQLQESILQYKGGEIAFSSHFEAILQAEQKYMDNLVKLQEEYDQEFIRELLEEHQEALEIRTRKARQNATE
jgi:hypothetical protein